ncbi:MAG: hypothetical protein KDB61_00400, partial [Planctomycetes bacterium]|nr:hypothetical protein [Planctomycetota bacterium]
KADYRYHTRKRVLRSLTELLLKAGDFERGLARGKELLELDDRDISTRIWFGNLMCAQAETAEIGLGELAKLFGEIP